jgi:GntR family transcriptional regulator
MPATPPARREPLNPGPGVLYLQVKRELLRRIEAREWKPAQALPNERTLADQLQVSIGTLRRAVDELVHEHVLVRRQGKGRCRAGRSVIGAGGFVQEPARCECI